MEAWELHEKEVILQGLRSAAAAVLNGALAVAGDVTLEPGGGRPRPGAAPDALAPRVHVRLLAPPAAVEAHPAGVKARCSASAG